LAEALAAYQSTADEDELPPREPDRFDTFLKNTDPKITSLQNTDLQNTDSQQPGVPGRHRSSE
jgi:hypothetical protein